MASGLAGKVRRATESDEFDLSGYDQSRCDELAKFAFSEPFPLPQMVKLSFIVGGGKLVRQKYSDDLPKLFMSSLSAIGFVDDSTAACEAGSGGKYKYQHDTGKNLKFVHVFPMITSPVQPAHDGGDDEDTGQEQPRTHEEVLFGCSDKDFARLLSEHLLTYAQKKKFLDILKQRVSTLELIEGKMAKLVALSAEEQALFDGVGADELREKAKFLMAEFKRMVEEGQLTSSEKLAFLEDLEAKLAVIEEEIGKAEGEGKSKKVAALSQQREVVQKTKASIKEAKSASLPPLKHGSELQKLHRRLAELLRIEKASKGHYTMEELKLLGERPEIEEAISVLESRSRGWFEDEDVFQERLQACIKAGAASAKKSAGGSSSGRPDSAACSGFSSVSSGFRPAKTKASGPATRNAFGALDR